MVFSPMPHIIIEHSANVIAITDVQALVDAVHERALATGIAQLPALRTRATSVEHYAIADRRPENMFLAVTARLGPGRSAADKHRLIEAILDAIDAHLGAAQQTMAISVEYQEIDAEFRINKNNLRTAKDGTNP
jgi:5-carboxymethyl-2-hydroxymuconate isomerase